MSVRRVTEIGRDIENGRWRRVGLEAESFILLKLLTTIQRQKKACVL